MMSRELRLWLYKLARIQCMRYRLSTKFLYRGGENGVESREQENNKGQDSLGMDQCFLPLESYFSGVKAKYFRQLRDKDSDPIKVTGLCHGVSISQARRVISKMFSPTPIPLVPKPPHHTTLVLFFKEPQRTK